MYQIPEVQPKIQQKSDFFPVKARIYTVTYPQNFGYNTNHKYEKDTYCKSDIAIQCQRIEFENPGMFRDFFREVNIITDEQSERVDILLFHVNL